jgi:hypothetical protein
LSCCAHEEKFVTRKRTRAIKISAEKNTEVSSEQNARKMHR